MPSTKFRLHVMPFACTLRARSWSCRQFGKARKAYFRRRAETRRAENISARLGSAWHASVLDEENIAVLKQFYYWYLMKDNFKAKENINNKLGNYCRTD